MVPTAARVSNLQRLAALGCAFVLATLVWRDALGQGFYMDDFAMLRRSAERSFAEIAVEDLFGAFPGERTWPFWRPGWYLLFDVVHSVSGDRAVAFVGVALALLGGLGVAAYGIVERRAGAVAGGAAAALLWTTPAIVEGVVWPSAAFNVLPASLCLTAAAAAIYGFAFQRSPIWFVLSLAAVAASLTFKEAAYGFPLVVLAAFAVAPRDARGRRWLPALGTAVPFVVVIALHYRFRNTVDAGDLGVAATATATLRHLADVARAFTGVDAPDVAVLASVVVAFAVGCRARDPAARYAWCVAAAGLVPYVFRTSASRFLVFVAVPLSIALALTLLPAGASRARRLIGLAVLLAIVVVQAMRMPEALAGPRANGEFCRAFAAAALRDDLGADGVVVVDVVPTPLQNGLPDLFEQRLGRRVTIVDLVARPQPPFVVYLDPRFETLAPTTRIVQFTGGDPYRIVTKAEWTQTLIPLPLVHLVHRHVVVTDPSAVLPAVVAARDPNGRLRSAVVDGPPPFALDADGETDLVTVRAGALQRIDVVIDGDACLFVVHLGDLRRLGAVATVDGTPIELLGANGIGVAVPVPAGRHAVQITWQAPR